MNSPEKMGCSFRVVRRRNSRKTSIGVIWRPMPASPYVYQEPLFRGLVRALVVSLVGTMATLGHCLELAHARVYSPSLVIIRGEVCFALLQIITAIFRGRAREHSLP